MIDHEDAARRFAVLIAERDDIDAAGTAMDGVGPRVAGLLGNLFGLDHLHDLRLARIGLGVENVNARGAQARHHQIAPFDMRMRRIRTQTGGAGIPAEMVQLVAHARHFHVAENFRIAVGAGVDVDDSDGVRLLPGRIERGHIGEFFRRCLHGHARGWIKARIGFPSHDVLPSALHSTAPSLALLAC